MSILIIVSISILIIIIAIRYYLKRPYIHKNITLDLLPKYFKMLLYRGYESAFMIIKSKKDKKFLQFSKHIIKINEVDLELGFPLASWSQPYYEKLHDVLKKENIDYLIIPKKNDKELEFTDVNCKDNIEFCIKLVEIIFIQVFDYDKEDLVFNITLENGSPEDVKIGFE